MNPQILSIASRVATPLALAGLLVGVVYLLYARVLRMRIYSKLAAGHSFQVIDTAMRYVYRLAMVAVVLGIAAFTAVSLLPKPDGTSAADPREAKLELVDISLEPERAVKDSASAAAHKPAANRMPELRYVAPTLDVKLRNRGTVSTFLKRAEIQVLESITRMPCIAPMAIPVSYTYDVDLARPRPFLISQEVPAGGVDRFRIRLYDSRLKDVEIPAYRVRLLLVADADDKTLLSEEFGVVLPPKMEMVAAGSLHLA